jgi:hypothetical protein
MEIGEQLSGHSGVRSLPTQFRNPDFLLGNEPLAPDDVPTGLLQMAKLHGAVHGAAFTKSGAICEAD